MAIENSVSNDFYLCSSIILTFSIAAYPVCPYQNNYSRRGLKCKQYETRSGPGITMPP